MGPTVLVVDDDAAFRTLAARLLRASGLTVIAEADSIDAALRAAERDEPSAVLIDVGLPDGDGLDLARRLAALPWRPRILLTSVDADVVDADGLRLSGALAFVHKAALPDAPLARLLSGK
jgi:CheY-like chemotaxis protein